MARSSPLTRGLVRLIEDVYGAHANNDMAKVRDAIVDMSRFIEVVLNDPLLHEQLPKDFRDRLRHVQSSILLENLRGS